MTREIEEAGLSSTAADVLREMYSAQVLRGTEASEPVAIDQMTRISPLQGSELNRIVKEIGARETLEIGLAYGFSTVWMIDALQDGGSHIAVDPFQRKDWGGIGAYQAARLNGNKSFRLIEDYSIHALSELIRERRKFDLVFIDGNHRFDDVLVDFYLSDQLVEPGSLIAFDDLWMPSIRAAIRFILGNRAYAVRRQKCANMIVLEKCRDDDRPWTHFRPFHPQPFSSDWREGLKNRIRARFSR